MKFKIIEVKGKLASRGPMDPETKRPVPGAKRQEVKLADVVLLCMEGPTTGVQVNFVNMPKAFLAGSEEGDGVDIVLTAVPLPEVKETPAD